MLARSITGEGRTRQCCLRLTEEEYALLSIGAAISGHDSVASFVGCTSLARALRLATRRGMFGHDRKHPLTEDIQARVIAVFSPMLERIGEPSVSSWMKRLGILRGKPAAHRVRQDPVYLDILAREGE